MIDFRQEIINFISSHSSMERETADLLLETPPQPDLGDYALPCFRLAKEFRRPPQQIAEGLKADLEAAKPDWLAEVSVQGPYVNFFLSRTHLAESVLAEVLRQQESYGHQLEGEGKTILLEYSSPNIAKPFHVGHAFTTILGQALSNIYEALGYEVVRLNHLGDYGTQFGKLICAWHKWGDEAALAEDPIQELTRIYVKFHEELDKHPELDDQARDYFRRLENKEPEELALWEKFREVSLQEFNRLYKRMGISFDNYNGESFYSDQIPAVVDELRDKGLLEESQGAQVVRLDEYNLNPCLILKSDGTTIYASRDIAAVLYRDKKWDFYRNIYVVGSPQKNHFQQVFAVLEKIGFPKPKQNVFVGFGTVKFANGVFSSRAGNIIKLEDLLDQSVAKTGQIITQNNPDMSEQEIAETAEVVGLAAVSYTYLKNGRERDIFFDWDEVLDFEGDTAVYLLYTYARARSILRKSGLSEEDLQAADLSLLGGDEEFSLIKLIADYPEALRQAARAYEPSILLRNISQLARSYNRFYHNQSILHGEDQDLNKARLALTEAVCCVLKNGLNLCGMRTVERM